MSAFNYTAQRKLISGHTAGLSYDIESEMGVLEPDTKEVANPHTALSGNSETLFHRVDEFWTLETLGLGDDANGGFAKWQEFLYSVMSGEAFTFDAYGTIATPVDAVSAEYVPNSFKKPKRVSIISQTSNPTWAVGFRIRLL